jgi:hypothetical protein
MASAFEVASSFTKWALSNNLVPPLPAGMEGEYLANVTLAQVSPEGEDVLRSRSISSVVFNDPESKVYVYTERRVTQKELERLPQLIAGCDILYPHGTLDDLGGDVQNAQGSGFTLLNVVAHGQVYCCGSSVSPGNEATAGTMGALVRSADGTIYGLTNNHVTGGCNHSAIGLPILAPGVLDVSANSLLPFTIGFHDRVLPYALGTTGNVNIAENTDAALFKIENANRVSSMQGVAYDTPQTVINPVEGLVVEKVGRTTGHTRGRIVGRELRPIRVKATSGRNSFQAVIMFPGVFIVHGDHRPFSEGGDSGSLVIATHADGTRSAIGVVFAGGQDSLAPGGKRTSILPIGPILNRLGVTLVGGHNVTTPST